MHEEQNRSILQPAKLNASYRLFRSELAMARLLTFSLASKANGSVRHVLSTLENTEDASSSDSRRDHSIVMRGGPSTHSGKDAAIQLKRSEVALMTEEIGGYELHSFAIFYRDIHRIFENFLLDLYVEIAHAQPKVLKSNDMIKYDEILGLSDYDEIITLLANKKKRKAIAGRIQRVAKGI